MATRKDNRIIFFNKISWTNSPKINYCYEKMVFITRMMFQNSIGSANGKDLSCLDKFKCIDDDNIGPLWQHVLFIFITLRIFHFFFQISFTFLQKLNRNSKHCFNFWSHLRLTLFFKLLLYVTHNVLFLNFSNAEWRNCLLVLYFVWNWAVNWVFHQFSRMLTFSTWDAMKVDIDSRC